MQRFCEDKHRPTTTRSESSNTTHDGESGALLICSSSSIDSKPVAAFDGLLHRPLAPLGTGEASIEWELDGSPATPLTVFDERDPGLAVYNHRPLCVAFTLPVTRREINLRVRVTQPRIFVTVSHVLWS